MATDDDIPPGFEDQAKTSSSDADALAASLESVKVEETKTSSTGDVDEPDHSIRLQDGLREQPEAEIKTQSDTLYASASKFEDLPLSPEILQGEICARAAAMQTGRHG